MHGFFGNFVKKGDPIRAKRLNSQPPESIGQGAIRNCDPCTGIIPPTMNYIFLNGPRSQIRCKAPEMINVLSAATNGNVASADSPISKDETEPICSRFQGQVVKGRAIDAIRAGRSRRAARDVVVPQHANHDHPRGLGSDCNPVHAEALQVQAADSEFRCCISAWPEHKVSPLKAAT